MNRKLKTIMPGLKYLIIIFLIIFLFRTYMRQNLIPISYGGWEGFDLKTFLQWFAYVVLGILLGVDSFIDNCMAEGKWKVNVFKLIILGIPALLLSTSILITRNIIHGSAFIFTPGVREFFRILTGYVIITGFYKSGKQFSLFT